MKRSAFFKLGLALPLAALLLGSCSKKRDPFLYGVMDASAIQIEVWNNDLQKGEMKFVPNLMVTSVSNSIIRTGAFDKNGSMIATISPYNGIYETDIETNYVDRLTDLSDKYTFTARTDDAQKLELWTNWKFLTSHEFNPGWGEYSENPSNNNIRQFSYLNGRIDVRVKALDQADSYRLIIMDPKVNGYGGTNLVRQWGDQFEIWREIPIGMVSDGDGKDKYEGAEFTGTGFDNPKYNGKKVFVAAVKNYGTEYSPMPVMLLSQPKTINIERGIFEEDEYPEPPCNCTTNPALCTCVQGTCDCDPCGCTPCSGN